MIGNDIVDLEDPETQGAASHPRFDERVLSKIERAAVAESRDAVRERWVFWAAKEAAYKLTRSEDARVVFSPPGFEVTRIGATRALVRWCRRLLRVDLRVHAGSVHAVARSCERARVLSATAKHDGTDPSHSVRALATQALAPALGVVSGELEIQRERDRPPVLLVRGRPTGAALSLSHHGRFVAFACEIPPGAGWSA